MQRRYLGVYRANRYIGSFLGGKLGLPVSKLIRPCRGALASPLAVLYHYSKNYCQNYIWGAPKQVIVCNGVLRSIFNPQLYSSVSYVACVRGCHLSGYVLLFLNKSLIRHPHLLCQFSGCLGKAIVLA